VNYLYINIYYSTSTVLYTWQTEIKPRIWVCLHYQPIPQCHSRSHSSQTGNTKVVYEAQGMFSSCSTAAWNLSNYTALFRPYYQRN